MRKKYELKNGWFASKSCQRFLEEVQRLVVIVQRVRVQRLERQRLRRDVVVLRVAERLIVQSFAFA